MKWTKSQERFQVSNHLSVGCRQFECISDQGINFCQSVDTDIFIVQTTAGQWQMVAFNHIKVFQVFKRKTKIKQDCFCFDFTLLYNQHYSTVCRTNNKEPLAEKGNTSYFFYKAHSTNIYITCSDSQKIYKIRVMDLSVNH